MLCMDKGSSLNIDLMISGNYSVIMTLAMSIYVYMYVSMLLSDRVIMDYDFFMLMYVCMHVCMSLSDRVVRDHFVEK